jgi:hypothetical protein
VLEYVINAKLEPSIIVIFSVYKVLSKFVIVAMSLLTLPY